MSDGGDPSMSERMKSPTTQKYTHVDRDDPRSRLHFVKYMKRDGKTRKIWECGICKFLRLYEVQKILFLVEVE